MSTFTCRNGHAVSIKDKFCSICGLPIRHMDGKEEPVTYEEYIREWEREKRQLRRTMQSHIPMNILELGKRD